MINVSIILPPPPPIRDLLQNDLYQTRLIGVLECQYWRDIGYIIPELIYGRNLLAFTFLPQPSAAAFQRFFACRMFWLPPLVAAASQLAAAARIFI